MSMIKETSMVYPSTKTPNHTITLPSLDTVLRSPYSHTPGLFVYTNKTTSKTFDTNTLKSSLSDALVPFYPLAGRLITNTKTNHLEIECNAKGVVFIEAETTKTLDDFGEFVPSDMLMTVAFPPAWDYSKGLSSVPILGVQLTRLECGGVMLGMKAHHSVQDGVSMAHFASSWSRLVRGLGISILPCHDRLGSVGPRDPPKVMFRHPEYESLPLSNVGPLGISESSVSNPTICNNLFKFSKSQISTLKQTTRIFEQDNHRPSTYVIMASHLWRSVCKARCLPYNEEVRLYIPINGRSRLKNPSLPQGYFGNVLFRGVCIAKAGDIANKPLCYTLSKVQETLTRMNNENYLRSAIDFLSLHPELTCLNPSLTWMQQERCPNLSINSWIGIPFNEVDFGSGEPSSIRLGGIGYEGQTLIMPSSNGDGSLKVSINLSLSHINILKDCIYEFDGIQGIV